jgi:hypothetical protein
VIRFPVLGTARANGSSWTMGLKQEAFYVLVWVLVALGVVVMFDRTGRLAMLLIAFAALAAVAAGLTWGVLVAFG